MTVTKRKSSLHARGNVRREKLINTGKELLSEKAIEDLSLANVAKKAAIPIGSVYHFFPNINSLLSEIASQFGKNLLEAVMQPYTESESESWQNIMRCGVSRSVIIYKENKSYQQLLIGGKTPAEIKFSDRKNDEAIGNYMIKAIDKHFILSDFPDRENVFYHAIEIIDVMLMLSVIEHNDLTDYMVEEAKRAGIAYLSCYLPAYLPKRNPFKLEP